MGEAIICAIIAAFVSIIGNIFTVSASTRKQTAKIYTQIALLDERIKAQKESIDKHNNFGQRIPVIEEQIKVINHRLEKEGK